ncbi:hypothetical protein PR202_ga13997 [Eleusine coracana subsp. coracana]|uniref:BED-type domain-containing protein n=1 Tax=Eleusine coracana subsp. coracana TaxID=191504 RepID=A0AAV5CGC6_ELECO|nr:hypothetical protein PR202_ga13997 [Eleusine coracana subsp. coracana]
MDKGDEDAAAAAGEEEVMPIGAQKHDPAWRHCAMVRSEGRTRLKCAYCGKHFLGGGIHRFKEHLARRPGNACCCPNVPHEVQETMLRSLEAVAAKKKRNLLLKIDKKRLSVQQTQQDAPSASNQIGGLGGAESPIHMIPLNEVLDFDPMPLQERPAVGAEAKTSGGRKKKKAAVSQPFTPPTPTVPLAQGQQPTTPAAHTHSLHQVAMAVDVVTPPALLGHADMEQVSMAVGRFLYDAGVPLEAVNSVYFQPMIETIASTGGRLEALSYSDFRGHILKRSLDDVMSQLEFYKETWTRTGCSVLADEWITDKGRTLINFSVHCPAVIRITEPLVHLLKLITSNKRPSVGYVYAGLYQAKVAIKKELVRKSNYMTYWNIIDWRWDNHKPRPLHLAGFFLNPLFFDGIRGDVSNIIFSGMLDCIERLVSDVKIQDKIQRELNMYRSEAAGDFRRQMAVRSRRTLPPGVDSEMVRGAALGIQEDEDDPCG